MISMQGRAFFQTKSAAERFFDAIPSPPPSKLKSIKLTWLRTKLLYREPFRNGYRVVWEPSYD